MIFDKIECSAFLNDRLKKRAASFSTPTIVVPSVLDIAENVKLQDEYKDRLKIPRRPPKDTWEDLVKKIKIRLK